MSVNVLLLVRELDNAITPGATITQERLALLSQGTFASGQVPAAVYPFVRDLALMPAGCAAGQVFFEGETIDLFAAR